MAFKFSTMRTKHWVITGLTCLFVATLALALLREIEREEATLKRALAGLVVLAEPLRTSGMADIVRTDRLALFLVPATSSQPHALNTISPLVPPTAFRVGAEHALVGKQVPAGEYWLIGITDKDGEILRPSPGEVYGRSSQPFVLGSRQIRLVLTQPFQGGLFNQAAPPNRTADNEGISPQDTRYGIAGTVVVAKVLQARMRPKERLIILLFDPELGRPVAFRIMENTTLPTKFSIFLPPRMRTKAKKAYQLRILTDRNRQPFQSVAGEVIGRSAKAIPLGTTNLRFELNQPYRR